MCIWIILTRPSIFYYKPVHFEFCVGKKRENGIWNGVNWWVKALILSFHLFPTGERSQNCVLEIMQPQVNQTRDSIHIKLIKTSGVFHP